MIEEIFAVGDSVLHRLDPRLKLIFVLLFSFFIALSNNLFVLGAGLIYAVLLTGLSRLPVIEVLKRLSIINIFNLLLWILLPLTSEGEVLYSIGKIELTRPGILLAFSITLKSNTILLAFIALIATAHLVAVAHALETLRVPSKLIHLLMFSYRYVFVIEQEYRRLANAAKMRCFHPKTNLHTYRTYAYMVGMLLVRASARAERVYQAMLCRGFDGRFYCLYQFRYTRLDLQAAILMGIVLLTLGGLQWLGWGKI